jgi:hypothetical protein
MKHTILVISALTLAGCGDTYNIPDSIDIDVRHIVCAPGYGDLPRGCEHPGRGLGKDKDKTTIDADD